MRSDAPFSVCPVCAANRTDRRFVPQTEPDRARSYFAKAPKSGCSIIEIETGQSGKRVVMTESKPLLPVYSAQLLFRPASLQRNRFHLAEECRNEFRYGRVNGHRALQRRVGDAGVHDVEDAVDGLVSTGTENGRAEDLVRFGVRDRHHEALCFALLDRAAD